VLSWEAPAALALGLALPQLKRGQGDSHAACWQGHGWPISSCNWSVCTGCFHGMGVYSTGPGCI